MCDATIGMRGRDDLHFLPIQANGPPLRDRASPGRSLALAGESLQHVPPERRCTPDLQDYRAYPERDGYEA
jgi:hypothetical protein